jgi:type VI secretion system secreted protein Hcp
MSCDYFLKIDGIDGESTDDKHKNEIEIYSFKWSEKQAATFQRGSGGGATGGKVQMNNFIFTMPTSKASPKLMLSCAKGDHIKSAILTCRKAGGGQQEFYKITLTDVLVSTYETTSTNGEGASAGEGEAIGFTHDGAPVDRVELAFAKIECEYRPQKGGGALDSPVKTGYNIAENKVV